MDSADAGFSVVAGRYLLDISKKIANIVPLFATYVNNLISMIMKNLLAFLTFVFACVGCHSNAQPTMRFLGIPVDGTQTGMIAALEKQGYVYDSDHGYLRGEFSGMDSYIYVVTNKEGVVFRVVVADVDSYDATYIKIRYNEVFRQILDCEDYDVYKGRMLTTGDDVAAGIAENAAQYHATFVPRNGANGALWFTIAEHYGSYYIMMFFENLDNQD